MTEVRTAFLKFKDEAVIIGRLLAGYSDIEIALLHCVQWARDDLDTVLKAMYRTRGETQRIDVADAFGRQYYRALKLGTDFEMAIGAARFCLKIRNQYSHCLWYDDLSGNLTFTNFEELAKQHDLVSDFSKLTRCYVNVPLLQSQEDYFSHTENLLRYVNSEGRFLEGKLPNRIRLKPAQLAQPDLYIP